MWSYKYPGLLGTTDLRRLIKVAQPRGVDSRALVSVPERKSRTRIRRAVLLCLASWL